MLSFADLWLGKYRFIGFKNTKKKKNYVHKIFIYFHIKFKKKIFRNFLLKKKKCIKEVLIPIEKQMI